MGSQNKIEYEAVKVGDTIPAFTVAMDRETYFAYNKLVKEINPLHFDEEHARKIGFKDIVVAGVYTFSFIPKLIADWVGEPGKIKNIEISYGEPVYIEEEVIYSGTVTKKYDGPDGKYVDCDVTVKNAEGTRFVDASVTLELS